MILLRVRYALQKTKLADATIVVVGENALRYDKDRTSGENLDRDDIELFGLQSQLVSALIKTGVPVVVVLVNSRPLAASKCADNTAPLIEAWEPSNAGGKALGEIIFGKVNSSGYYSAAQINVVLNVTSSDLKH